MSTPEAVPVAGAESGAASQQPTTAGRPFPPIAYFVVGSLVLVIVGGIYMASYFPRRPPLVVPTLLWAAAVVLCGVALVMLARLAEFAWTMFRTVWLWALLAYVVIAGMIEYAFIHNGARGAPLALVTLMLAVFAVDVPTVIAVTVARYQTPTAGDLTPPWRRSR